MPTWRFHLATGILLTVFLIYICYYLGFWYIFIIKNEINFLFLFHLFFISLLNSLLPDFDERKTKIHRWLGVVLALFVIFSAVYIYRIDFSISDIPSLFFLALILIIILFILGWVIPFRHHGTLHSALAAFLFAGIWIVLELALFQMSYTQALLIGGFGFIGYLSHLVLDRDLKWY